MTSYIDTTATAVSQIKNKPEATGFTSTTSIDMTRNNEHENNNQELKNIKTIEVNLTGLGSMKAKEKKGTLKIEFRDRTETIQENEIIIVPKGVEHKPIAKEEVSIMLFEPATTINTGALENERTRKNLESI